MGGQLSKRVLRVTAGVAALGAALMAGAPAHAYTTVSGANDSAAPLVIDPSSSPGTPVTSTSATSSEIVMFVQDMPTTKLVDEVTLGDLALGSGCTTGNANVKIEEYATGVMDNNATLFYSQGPVPITTTPSKLTWQFAPLTMRAGRGYAFRVSVSGCSSFTHITWPHNASQVNPGSARCTGGPNGWRRLWHEQGVEDAVAECVTKPPATRKFQTGMPTGWLVSRRLSGNWDVVWYAAPGIQPCYYTYPNSYDDWGGISVYWMMHDAYPYPDRYVCQWSQVAPYGTTVPHGWYYALPWLQHPYSAPRDAYLRLGVADQSNLLAQHAPVLFYDGGETFHALSPGSATDFYDDSDDPEDANRLLDSFGTFATANPDVASGEGIDQLDLDYLAAAYSGISVRNGTDAISDDYISERGDGTSLIPPFGFTSDGYAADAAQMEGLPGYSNRVYGRVARDGSVIWLQYWIYYYFDSQGSLGWGPHEGDWEMVQVGLNESTLQPLLAAYAQHGDGEMCGWPAMSSIDGHPLVYVAQSSHASYFRPGDYGDPDPDDDADGDGLAMSPIVEPVVSESPNWLAWPGKWGDSDASPRGPAHQGEKWSDPGGWAAEQAPCDVD